MSGSNTHDVLVCDSQLQDGNNTDGITSARWIFKSPCEGWWIKNVVGCAVGMTCATSRGRGDYTSEMVGHKVGMAMCRLVW